jgi:hypothetical protein
MWAMTETKENQPLPIPSLERADQKSESICITHKFARSLSFMLKLVNNLCLKIFLQRDEI